MTEYKLSQEIINLSDADCWDLAKLEWELEDVYREDEPDTCLCGRFPINEICVLRNKRNNNQTIVGNVCVKKFLGLPSDKIFQAIHRISEDDDKALNAEAIDHARKKGWINDWEKKFYIDTWRKRKLTRKQHVKRLEINKKVLGRVINQYKK